MDGDDTACMRPCIERAQHGATTDEDRVLPVTPPHDQAAKRVLSTDSAASTSWPASVETAESCPPTPPVKRARRKVFGPPFKANAWVTDEIWRRCLEWIDDVVQIYMSALPDSSAADVDCFFVEEILFTANRMGAMLFDKLQMTRNDVNLKYVMIVHMAFKFHHKKCLRLAALQSLYDAPEGAPQPTLLEMAQEEADVLHAVSWRVPHM